MTTTYISEDEIAKHFPEFMLKIEKDLRLIITRDNVPFAVLLTIEDLRRLEGDEKAGEGLASVIGKWDDFDEFAEFLSDIPSMREKGGFGRDVSSACPKIG